MPETSAPKRRADWLNVPNQLTIARLALTIVLLILLELGWYIAGLFCFLIAAGTDWVDGYWARKYGQITQLGRILDPFADKLIICGTFIYLAAAPQLADGTVASGVAAWMVVVIVAREMLVTALRSFVESQGGDFSANWAGKWKMALQCAAACLSIYQLSYVDGETLTWDPQRPEWLPFTLAASLWSAVALTAYSGLAYVFAAIAMLRKPDANAVNDQ